jgi:hypothetical protein
MLTPTRDLAKQHQKVTGAHLVFPVNEALEGRDPCVQPDLVKKMKDAHLPLMLACMNCPSAKGCNTREGIGKKSKGTIATFSYMGAFKSCGITSYILDELPSTLVDTVTISLPLDLPDDEPFAVGEYGRSLIRGEGNDALRSAVAKLPAVPKVRLLLERGKAFERWARQAKTSLYLRRIASDKRARVTVEGDKLTARLTPLPIRYLADHGGIVLSASASPLLIRALGSDEHPAEVIPLDARDDVQGTERVHVRMGATEGGRAGFTDQRLTKIVEDIKARAAGRKTLIVTFKKWGDQMTSAVGDWATVRHYGAIAGLDDWKGYGMFVTIGDPWTNLDAVGDIAEHYGIDDRDQLLTDMARGELEQAHGRARDPRRGENGPCTHLHYGHLLPGRWERHQYDLEEWAKLAHSKGITIGAIRDLQQYTDDNGKPMTLDDIAAELGVSRITVARLTGKNKSAHKFNPLDPFAGIEAA